MKRFRKRVSRAQVGNGDFKVSLLNNDFDDDDPDGELDGDGVNVHEMVAKCQGRERWSRAQTHPSTKSNWDMANGTGESHNGRVEMLKYYCVLVSAIHPMNSSIFFTQRKTFPSNLHWPSLLAEAPPMTNTI